MFLMAALISWSWAEMIWNSPLGPCASSPASSGVAKTMLGGVEGRDDATVLALRFT